MMELGIEPGYATNQRRKLFVAWVVLLLAWLIMTFAPPLLGNKTGRLLADPFDRGEYIKMGNWFNDGTLPISEYPQIPTLLFGLNHLISNWVEPNLQSGQCSKNVGWCGSCRLLQPNVTNPTWSPTPSWTARR